MNGGEETEKKNGSEQNTNNKVLEKVGEVIATINEAKNVDQVICALHSLAVRLFSLESRSFAGHLSFSNFSFIIQLHCQNFVLK